MAIWDKFSSDDAANMLDDLGESVVYVRRNAAGQVVERRPVNAIVHRQPNRFDRESTNGSRTAKVAPIRIVIVNDSASGIASAELDRGLDRIELETIVGDPQTKRELKMQMPRENERTQNDARFHTFELY